MNRDDFDRERVFTMSEGTPHGHTDSLGGTLDGLAVGFGLGMAGMLFTIHGAVSIPTVLGGTVCTAVLGAALGTWWGARRGY